MMIGRIGHTAVDGTVNGFGYDANGNIIKDPLRDIVLIKYNHYNLPTDIYFGNGQRQTIRYAGRVKRSVSYSQTTSSNVGSICPDDDEYAVTSVRYYVGPHVFRDGEPEYSAFDGGYFDPDRGTNYYVRDWQGNVAAVLDKRGVIVQSTDYYPYGEPTVEPDGQRYLFGGKEREHAGGRNAYDFGARNLTPYCQWSTVDPLGYKTPWQSPYSYCGGDPINRVDRDGLEKRCLSSDTELQQACECYPDNGNIIVFAHGNEYLIAQDYNLPSKKILTDGIELFNAIVGEFDTVDPLTFNAGMYIIELYSCNTGKIMKDGEEPVAQKISRTLSNALIKAPNGFLGTGLKDGKSHVYSTIEVDPKTKKMYGIYQKENPWRYFYQGNDVSPLSMALISDMITRNGIQYTIKYIMSTLYEMFEEAQNE